MKHLVVLVFFGILFLNGLALEAQSIHGLYRNGDKAYQSQDYSSAEIDYRKALELESSTQGT